MSNERDCLLDTSECKQYGTKLFIDQQSFSLEWNSTKGFVSSCLLILFWVSFVSAIWKPLWLSKLSVDSWLLSEERHILMTRLRKADDYLLPNSRRLLKVVSNRNFEWIFPFWEVNSSPSWYSNILTEDFSSSGNLDYLLWCTAHIILKHPIPVLNDAHELTLNKYKIE